MTIELAKQKFFTEKFSKLNLKISEYSFANIYLFQNIHRYKLVENDNFIKGVGYDGLEYIMPLIDLRTISQAACIELLQKHGCFFPIPEEWISHFQHEQFTTTFFEQDSDYIYQIDRLKTLSGRDLSSRRNLVHQFLDHYTPTMFPINKDHRNDVLHILSKWKEHVKIPLEKTDFTSCLEAFEKMDILELEGYIFYADDEPVGFVVGEKKNEQMFVLHFAKADTNFKGIYQYMYQELANTLYGRFQFLNVEQDLGSQNLRQSKRSFHPERYIKKYRIHNSLESLR